MKKLIALLGDWIWSHTLPPVVVTEKDDPPAASGSGSQGVVPASPEFSAPESKEPLFVSAVPGNAEGTIAVAEEFTDKDGSPAFRFCDDFICGDDETRCADRPEGFGRAANSRCGRPAPLPTRATRLSAP